MTGFRRWLATWRGSAAKRIFDFWLAALLLIVLVPLFAVLALAIRLDSRGPVFYRCRRVGLHGRAFSMIKFRKMHADAHGPALTIADDSRFTRIGRVLAAWKLDELPQLWNVVKGEMSLVGPRPEDPEYVSLHPEAYEDILSVRPGITGLTQLAFVRESALLDPDDRVTSYVERLLPQKVGIDLLYASRPSFWLDLRILGWTAVATLARCDLAVHRHTGRVTIRRRPEIELQAVPARGPEVS